MSKNYALFVGRWQPFHNGHDYIIRQKLNEGVPVLIAVRDTPISDSDPYSAQERVDMISEHYKNDDVKVIVIPDIESVNIGRKVGYKVNRYDAPRDIEGISASDIRKMMDEGNEQWKNKVPKVIADFLISKGNLEQTSENGLVVWFTGLSGAGKSTLANALRPRLSLKGNKVKILDGDEVRHNLTLDLGFSKADRSENIKRISYVAKCIADCEGTAIVAAISPYEEDRARAKELIGGNRMFMVYVQCDIKTLIERDVKGLYKRALAGEIENFTGISDPYEAPLNPECIVDTANMSVDKSISLILKTLNKKLSSIKAREYMLCKGQNAYS